MNSPVSDVLPPQISEKKSKRISEAFVTASRRVTPEAVESAKNPNKISGLDGT